MSNFRGNWNASQVKPAFNAFVFLPTAPAMKPRVRLEEGASLSSEHQTDPSVGEEWEDEEEEEGEGRRVLDAPPAEAEVMCSILDRDTYVRREEGREGGSSCLY